MTSVGRRAVLVALAATGCGFRPLADAARAPGKLNVVAGASLVPEPGLVVEVVAGAAAALAREGVLGGAGDVAFRIELVRLDERSEGVLRDGDSFRARGTTIALTGRGVVASTPERDTGDVTVADPAGLSRGARDDVLRALARRLGEALAQRALGGAAPSEAQLPSMDAGTGGW